MNKPTFKSVINSMPTDWRKVVEDKIAFVGTFMLDKSYSPTMKNACYMLGCSYARLLALKEVNSAILQYFHQNKQYDWLSELLEIKNHCLQAISKNEELILSIAYYNKKEVSDES